MPRKKKVAKKKPTKKVAKKAVKPKARKSKRGKRYSEKAKNNLLGKYHDLRKTGMAALAAAKKLGVSYITLLSWEKKSGKKVKVGRPSKKKIKSALKKAVKLPKRGRPKARPYEGLALVTPAGYRIEGISAKDLIAVLKALK
jgi:hypothetical protein